MYGEVDEYLFPLTSFAPQLLLLLPFLLCNAILTSFLIFISYRYFKLLPIAAPLIGAQIQRIKSEMSQRNGNQSNNKEQSLSLRTTYWHVCKVTEITGFISSCAIGYYLLRVCIVILHLSTTVIGFLVWENQQFNNGQLNFQSSSTTSEPIQSKTQTKQHCNNSASDTQEQTVHLSEQLISRRHQTNFVELHGFYCLLRFNKSDEQTHQHQIITLHHVVNFWESRSELRSQWKLLRNNNQLLTVLWELCQHDMKQSTVNGEFPSIQLLCRLLNCSSSSFAERFVTMFPLLHSISQLNRTSTQFTYEIGWLMTTLLE